MIIDVNEIVNLKECVLKFLDVLKQRKQFRLNNIFFELSKDEWIELIGNESDDGLFNADDWINLILNNKLNRHGKISRRQLDEIQEIYSSVLNKMYKLDNFCLECENIHPENCYKNKSCLDIKNIKKDAVKNNDKNLMIIYIKAPENQINNLCRSCEIGKPKYCTYKEPICLGSKYGNNVCKHCANGKKDCLRLKKCQFPNFYNNSCNICLFTAYNVADYRKHVKSKKHKKKAEKLWNDLSFHEFKEITRRDYLKPLK